MNFNKQLLKIKIFIIVQVNNCYQFFSLDVFHDQLLKFVCFCNYNKNLCFRQLHVETEQEKLDKWAKENMTDVFSIINGKESEFQQAIAENKDFYYSSSK